MSEFLAQLQARLRARLPLNQQSADQASPGALANTRSSFSTTTMRARFVTGTALPRLLARSLQYIGMALTALAVVYWSMRIVQAPSAPGVSVGSNPGITLYSNQDSAAANDVFGSKPLTTDAIFLRGVVATGKTPSGALDGFAIFEIDGKPSQAISVGESLGKGLTLYAIGDESATLLYQGQKLEFKLNKASKPSLKAPKKT